MTETIAIMVCSNAGFFQHVGVMLVSLLSNNPAAQFDIVLVTGAGPSDERHKLERTIARFPAARFAIRDFTPPKTLGLYTPGPYTTDNYARLWVADFFGPEVDRALYLDADMVVLGDIGELWRTDLAGKLLGAVDIPGSTRWRELGMPGEYGYFNSGLLLFDLEQWRRTDALARVLAVLKEYGEALNDVDQDGLNICFCRERKHLDYKWNVVTPFYTPSHDLQLPAETVAAVQNDARIVHFNGRSRPWSYHSRHPRKAAYYTYLAQTEWRDFSPADRTLGDIVRKAVGPLIPTSFKRRLRPLLE